MTDTTGTASATWTSRWIVKQDGYVDLPYNRTTSKGDDDAGRRLTQLRQERFPTEQIAAAIRRLLIDGTMQTRKAQDFTLFEDGELIVTANTNASAGYCYVETRLKDSKPQEEQA